MSYYLFGICQGDLKRKTYKLTRMEFLTVLKDNFTPVHIDFEEQFKDCWYLRSGGELKTIRIKFFGEAARSIEEYQLHHSQQVEDRGEGFVIIKWSLPDLNEFSSWLLGFLGNFEVLEPVELLDQVHKRIDFFHEKHRVLSSS
ncbi:MAG: WYL domain-containing protein [Lentisphaeraceae bacterium]|nr:WYL domain-containing protein [Lentisphaeraceae bacterium]